MEASLKEMKDAVIDERMIGMAIRAFAELEDKRKIAILYLEEGDLRRYKMRTEPIEGHLGDAPAGKVRIFKGFVRRGDMLDVVEGGTIWDRSIRYGVVTRFSEVLWFEGGSEKQVMDALMESGKHPAETKQQNHWQF